MNIILVSDNQPIDISAALCILIAQKSFSAAHFYIAHPNEKPTADPVIKDIFEKYTKFIYNIPQPALLVENKDYRIINKINALRFFPKREPAIFIDSDFFFLRSLDLTMFSGRQCAAAPEHGKHLFPWDDIYQTFRLPKSKIHITLGSGETAPHWLNAGFVFADDPSVFGSIWHMYAIAINELCHVPERYPYLDQIALPIAMTHYRGCEFSHDCVLSERFNQNLYNWALDQSHVTNGFCIHHHNRVKLIRKYFSTTIIPWVRDGFKDIDYLIDKLMPFEKP